MRSRTVREGSVGLFFLLGIGLFVAMSVWLRQTYFGDRGYQAIVEFDNAAGMQIGTPVRYRGVKVGQVMTIKPATDKVNVEIKITEPGLIIPRNVRVEVNQSGFIGQNAIDIVPTETVSASIQGVNPLDPSCKDRNLIICNNDSIKGQVGFSLDEFLRLYTDEKFYANINSAIQNTAMAAQSVSQLSRDLSSFTVTAKQQLTSVSAAANAIGRTAEKFGPTADKLNRTVDQFAVTANQISATANRTADQFALTANQIGATANRTADRFNRNMDLLTATANRTANQLSRDINQISTNANRTIDRVGTTVDRVGTTFERVGNNADRTVQRVGTTFERVGNNADRTVQRVGTTFERVGTNTERTVQRVGIAADRFGATAEQLGVTAGQVGSLATNINNLVTNNQASLVATLDNLSKTSAELRTVVSNLNPAINRIAQGELIKNLETLSANAAQTSANLRDLTGALNNPFTLLVLQQTLDSARVTFQNAQKITSDLDDLTGDPAFRNKLRNLVNGLSDLVSSTNQLQEQVEVARFLTPMVEAANMNIPQMPSTFQMDQISVVDLSMPIVSPSKGEAPKSIIFQRNPTRENPN
ncbi:MlaD family protein [Microseira wollei]|uniref:Methyl-accepting chemotaxis sensory transducer n=1 Tax=Microseira wollei NIES-4236 TaxID=2530354 RepID=A0AAV3XCD4_9CYAN|nr:MlaD family protein [Microseira wollei]GET39873.1 methyl-accepting chemotaxis sensory transducer [Microseira wollei NIES-4236]